MGKKEINASVAIQVLPNVVGSDEVVRVVDEVIEFIKSKGLKINVAPFETTIEGDFDELMEIVKECQVVAVKAGAEGVMSYVKINYKPKGDILKIDEKISKWDRDKIPVLEMEYRKNNKTVTEILSVGDIKFSKYLRKKEVKDKTQNEEMLLIIGRKNGR